MAQLHADPGRTLLYSLIVGFPTAVIAGPLFARFITRACLAEPGAIAAQLAGGRRPPRPPSLAITLLTILMPVLLMLAAALAQARAARPAESARRWSSPARR